MIRITGLIAALLLLPGQAALALGLGDLHVDSGLHEEFEARIDLVALNPGDINRITVGLADAEVFERAGVARPHHLTTLKFEPVSTGDAAGHIRVTSRDRIREPYLNFIIELRWPDGKLLREYTALLKTPR